MGNPILGDDKAGLLVAQKLKEKLSDNHPNINIIEYSGNAMKLAEMMLGYDRVLIADCFKAETSSNDRDIIILSYKKETESGEFNALEPHDIDLFSALNLLRKFFPDEIPDEIKIFGIKCNSSFTFSEEISEKTAHLIDRVVNLILNEVEVKNK